MSKKSHETLRADTVRRCHEILLALSVAGIPDDRLTCIALFAAGSSSLIMGGMGEEEIRAFYAHALESALSARETS